MIRRLRSSAPARLALCAAALLSIVAAFGLHPEPGNAVAAAPGARMAAHADVAAPSHGCPACLHAGSAVLAMETRLAPSSESASAPPALAYAPPCADLPRAAAGRSPPAESAS